MKTLPFLRAALLLGIALLVVAPKTVAQTTLADSVRSDLWVSAFAEALRDRRDLFDQALNHAVAPNADWVRRMRPIQAVDTVVRPFHPTLSVFEVYRDRSRYPRRWASGTARSRRFTEMPALPDTLAKHAYAVLTGPTPATRSDIDWRRWLLREIRAGRLPATDAPLADIAEAVDVRDSTTVWLRGL